jgi:transcriptional regulator with XRE-family HTH domain
MADQEDATFGAALARALKAKHRKQAWLAEELHTDPGQVSRWINNKARPHIDTLGRIEELLEADLSEAFELAGPAYELFVSTPISGLDIVQIEAHREDVAQVVKAAEQVVDGVYWSGVEIVSVKDLGAPDLATEATFKEFAHCKAYLYLQFAEILNPSGALVELGFALGRRIKTTMIIRKDLRTPYMFEGFQGVAARLDCLPDAHIYTVESAAEAARLITRHGRRLLGLD